MRSLRITSLSHSAPALLGVLALSLLAGCGGGGGGNGNSNPGPTTTGTNNTSSNNTSPSANSVSATSPGGLVATLSEPSTVVGINGSVTYTLSIRNPTAASIAIQTAFPSAPTSPSASLVVRDAAGNKVYEPNPPPSPPVYNAVLAPGQTLTTTFAVSAFAARGTYYATANFGETNPATPVGPLAVTAQ